MQILSNSSLRQYNTFGLDVKANKIIILESEADIIQILSEVNLDEQKILILGGGSNLLFLNDFDGIVLKNNCKGMAVIEIDSQEVIVDSSSGEVWDDLVDFCVNNEFYGIENLKRIPGNVGAAPVQNIGAYGVELQDCFHSLSGYDLNTKEKREFNLEDCKFGYRDSIFKNEFKDKFLITSVRIKLSLKKKFNLHYRALKDEFGSKSEEHITIQQVSNAVKRIRESKLPDVSRLGNAGSFFKNPEINSDKYLVLKSQFPSLVAFELDNGNYKLAAAWLIEQCGFKGKKNENVGCYEKQSLVIVNYGNATGGEIKEFSERIQNSVLKKFGITLDPEVNII